MIYLSKYSLDQRASVGISFLIIAFTIPIIVGSYFFITSVLPFSLDLKRYSESFSIMHFGFLMLPAQCLVGIFLIRSFKKREDKSRIWYYCLFFLFFVGGGDFIASLMSGNFPFPILPLSFGGIGLALTYKWTKLS